MSDFLKDMRDAGEEYAGSDSQGVIGQIKVEFGCHRWVSGHDFWTFWKPVGSKADISRVSAELQGRLQEAGSTDAPNFGIRVTIKKEVLSRDTPYERDLSEFTAAWQKDSFGLIMDNLEQGQLPVNEWFFGRVRYIANPFFVKKGDAGKTDTDQDGNPRFPSVRVPVEKFTDEAAARAAVVTVGGESANSYAWSETAKANLGDDIASFSSYADEVRGFYHQVLDQRQAIGGYELPKPLTNITTIAQLAEIYSVEPDDIKILLDIAPF